MYVLNITDDYDNITDINFTNNCTENENNIDIFIPTFLLTIPCISRHINFMFDEFNDKHIN